MVIGGRRRKWVQKVNKSIKRRGTKGRFTSKTKSYNKKHRKNFSTLQFACYVRKNSKKFDDKTIDQANFALNMNKKRFKCKSKSRRRRSRR